MMDKEDRTRMLPKSSNQKTLLAAMEEERATTANRRFLSKDASSVSNPSFRVYYGIASAGSVPFVWESAPGTPKNAISSTTLPPLTPPPSYYSSKGAAKNKFTKSQSSKKLLSSKPASFVQSIFPKLRRSHTMPPRSPSAPPSRENAQVQCTRSRRNRLLASPRSSFSSNSRGDDDDDAGGAASSPTCFRMWHSGGGTGRLHGLLASMVAGGQVLRTTTSPLGRGHGETWRGKPQRRRQRSSKGRPEQGASVAASTTRLVRARRRSRPGGMDGHGGGLRSPWPHGCLLAVSNSTTAAACALGTSGRLARRAAAGTRGAAAGPQTRWRAREAQRRSPAAAATRGAAAGPQARWRAREARRRSSVAAGAQGGELDAAVVSVRPAGLRHGWLWCLARWPYP